METQCDWWKELALTFATLVGPVAEANFVIEGHHSRNREVNSTACSVHREVISCDQVQVDVRQYFKELKGTRMALPPVEELSRWTVGRVTSWLAQVVRLVPVSLGRGN